MAVGWRDRQQRQAGLGPLPTPPELGEVIRSEDACTWRPRRRMRRWTGSRSAASIRAEARVTVTASGGPARTGRRVTLFIAVDRLRGVGVATCWTVDRGVEHDGLVSLRWILSNHLLTHTYTHHQQVRAAPDSSRSAATSTAHTHNPRSLLHITPHLLRPATVAPNRPPRVHRPVPPSCSARIAPRPWPWPPPGHPLAPPHTIHGPQRYDNWIPALPHNAASIFFPTSFSPTGERTFDRHSDTLNALDKAGFRSTPTASSSTR